MACLFAVELPAQSLAVTTVTWSSPTDFDSAQILFPGFTASRLSAITSNGISHNHGNLAAVYGMELRIDGNWVNVASWSQDARDHLLFERTVGGGITFSAGVVDGIRFASVPAIGAAYHSVSGLFTFDGAYWATAAPGDLLSAANWSDGTAPNAVDAVATFFAQPAVPGNFTLNGAMTLGTLDYANPQSRSISGSGTLTLTTSTGRPVIAVNGGDLEIATTVAGSGFTKAGPGTLVLTGSNTYSGTGTTILAGTLGGNTIANSGVASSFGTGSTFSMSNGATLEYSSTTSDTTTDRTITLGSGGGTISVLNAGRALILNGAISGSGSVTKIGSGMMTLTAANTYAGQTTIVQGVLAVTGNGTVGSGIVQIGSGASLQLGNGGGPLTTMVASNIANDGQVVYAADNDNTYAGEISGNGSLVLHDSVSSTLTLSSANTYSN